MKVKILIFIALAIFFIGASCQSTKTKKVSSATKATPTKKDAAKPKTNFTTTKKSGGGNVKKAGSQTTKKVGSGTAKKTGSVTTKKGEATFATPKPGAKISSGPKLRSSASTPPVFTAPPTPPVYTCNNITGISNFRFADFATGQWYLHREMCAFPFNPWFGTCGVGNFTLDAAKTSSNLVVSTFLEGTFQNSPSSTLKPVGTNGIMNWEITTVGIKTDTMPSTSTIKMVVIDTDYTNYAGVHVCGDLCVQVPSNKPAHLANVCSPGQITAYYIFLRSRTLAKNQEDAYIKTATDALNVKWPYMLFMPDEQNPMVCKN